MATKYTSWRQKLEHPPAELPKVVELPEDRRKAAGGRRMLVATPMMVDEEVRTIRKGKKPPRVENFEKALVKD